MQVISYDCILFIYKIYMKKFLSGIALWALWFLAIWNVLVSAQEVEETINPTDEVEMIEPAVEAEDIIDAEDVIEDAIEV